MNTAPAFLLRFALLVTAVAATGNELAGQRPPPPLTVVSYNIRHGRGSDDSVDIARTAAALERLTPDVVALQEVDDSVERSGRVKQPAELGRLLGMEHAFGLFFPYQGGGYGTALLSKHPIISSRTFPLPDGDTLRVALAAELMLPDSTRLMVVNIHFDYRGDDTFRYSQASTLARWLDSLTIPWLLMGDFNDEPHSRTVALFDQRATRAVATSGSPLTFPAPEPVKEIDFVYLSHGAPWRVASAHVADEPLASDHRPVVVRLESQPAQVELDHIFIAVPTDGVAEADALRQLGFVIDSSGSRHEGQGTASRSVLFDNIYLELIHVDSTVALSDNARPMRDRTARAGAWRTTGASPFGIGLRQVGGSSDFGIPATPYAAEWMQPGTSITMLVQPDEPEASEVFVVPQYLALTSWVAQLRASSYSKLLEHANSAHRVSAVHIEGPASHRPEAAEHLAMPPLTISTADSPLMTVVFDEGRAGVVHDLRPLLPLVIRR